MQYRRHAPVRTAAVGLLVFAFWFGIGNSSPEILNPLQVLTTPLLVVAILGLWAKSVFLPLTNPKKARQFYFFARRAAIRVAIHTWNLTNGVRALYQQGIRRTDELRQLIMWNYVRPRTIPAFRLMIRDLLWLTLVVAILTRWWMEHELFRERVADLERSDAVVATIKQSLCVDETGLGAYLSGLKKLPKMPTNARVRYIGPMIFNGSPAILPQKAVLPARATPDAPPPPPSLIGGYQQG